MRHLLRRSTVAGPVAWMGSLPQDAQDASGLIYRRNRFYDPKSGRFTQEDPIGLAGGVNSYGFAEGDPVTYSDPHGLCAEAAAGDSTPRNSGKCTVQQAKWVKAVGEDHIEEAPFYADPTVWVAGLASGLRALGLRTAAAVVGRRAAIGVTGQVGESALSALGGESQVFFRTSLGSRTVDQLVNGVAHESKVGAVSLTRGVATQIAKDTELLSTGQVKSVVWHFFKSPVTGLGGPTVPLRDALTRAGIQIITH